MRSPALLLAAALTTAAVAQPMPGGPPGPPPRIDFARELGVSSAKAAQVESILANEREQHRAAREKARAELAKVLTPEELARLEQLMPRPPRPPGHGPMGGPPPERR
jgi:hypothetical protein